jgi:hypothetical protein
MVDGAEITVMGMGVHQIVAIVLLVLLILMFFAVTLEVNFSYTTKGTCAQTYNVSGTTDSITYQNAKDGAYALWDTMIGEDGGESDTKKA